MLQCEVPRGHNFLSHVAAALNLDRSGMESARRAAPSPGEALLPTPFPVRELGDTWSWSSSEPRPHQHTRSSSDTLNSSGFLCMPEGGSTCLDTLSRTLTWTYHTFLPCPPACKHIHRSMCGNPSQFVLLQSSFYLYA